MTISITYHACFIVSEEARQLKEENEILKGQLGLSNHQLTKTEENLNRAAEASNRKNYHLKLCEAKVDNAVSVLDHNYILHT